MTHPVRSEFLAVNGLRLHARIAGEGPVVLMVHGFPGSSFSWRHQMQPLAAAGYTAVAIDTRGYGLSDRPAEGYGLPVLVQDLVGVLDALEVDRAVVVGQDFGSRYAWNLARQHPDRVLAVAGTVPFSDLTADQRPTELWQALAGQHFLHLHYFQEVGRAERDLGGPHVEEFLHRLLWALSAEGDYFSVFGHADSRAEGPTSYLDALPVAPPLPWAWLDQDEFDQMVVGFRHGEVGREFAGGFGSYRAGDPDWEWERQSAGRPIEVPALLVIGEHDPVRKFTATDLALFPHFREQVIADAGHHVQQEQPAAFTAALLEFVRSNQNGPRPLVEQA